MRKLIQIVSIGVAAYNLYVMVTDFLETEQGQKVKAKVMDYAEKAKPYMEEASDYASELAEKVADRVETKKAGIV